MTDVFFHHPKEDLLWGGPDDGVHSLPTGHCGVDEFEVGIPALIVVGDDIGFWGARAVVRQDGWRWTGYYHGNWQIWQGDDPLAAYVVSTEEPALAFEYVSFGCI